MLTAVSLLVAAAAFVVACLSVYVASLRHARIEIDVTSAAMEHSGAIGPVPMTSSLSVTLLATNEGARAGLLEGIRVLRPKANVDLWRDLQLAVAPAQFPLVLQGYQSIGYQWSYTYTNQVSQDPVALENLVSNVERLTLIEVEVEWEYHRSSGFPFTTRRVPRWLRRTRRRVPVGLSVSVDPTLYRASLANHWRQTGRPDLADRVAS